MDKPTGTHQDTLLSTVSLDHTMEDRRPPSSLKRASRLMQPSYLVVCTLLTSAASAFHPAVSQPRFATRLHSDWDSDAQDSNQWRSMDDEDQQEQSDWQETLASKKDGTYWTSFEPSSDEELKRVAPATPVNEDQAADAWLDTLASLSAEEIEFNMKEADRADKVRMMQEWGFDAKTIANTLDVATDSSLELDDTGMQKYREQSYWEEVDLQTVESHTLVEKYEDGEPVRSKMVYVDEHTCIGCTNCAMIAQSTFFMHQDHGRARVFQQWGDDEETIQIAIETCPVDCIHYVPYEELVKLEKERRGQNINFKARLVSQAEYGNTLSHRVGGPNSFTAPQVISGNMSARCNNCPTRGCYNCPMYGVGKNPEFEKKEAARKERIAKRKLQEQREREQKKADL